MSSSAPPTPATKDAGVIYNIRDIVLAKLKGYPQWPAMVRVASPPPPAPR